VAATTPDGAVAPSRALLTAAEEGVVETTVRAVLGCVAGFDERVLTTIAAALRTVVPFHRTAVFVEEDDGKSFRILWRARVVGANEGDKEMPTGSRLASIYVGETTGPDPATASPEVVEDMAVRTSPGAQLGIRAGLLSYVRLPLVHDGVGYGWWLVGHDVVGAPSQRALPLLQRLAAVIAPAVARARVSVRYALLRSLVEESPDGMLGLDQGLHVSESNAAADRMLGRTRAQVVGAKLADLIGAQAAETIGKAAEGTPDGTTVSFALPATKASASPRWVDAVVARVSGTTEATVQVHLRDARARRAAEDANAKRVEQLAFQRALGEVMASDLRADRSLGRAVDLCFVRFELGALCALRREPDGMLRLVASHGAGPLLKARLARISEGDLERLVLVMPARTAARGPGTIEATGVRLPDDAPGDGPRWARLAPLVHARRRLGALLAVGHAGDAPQPGDREVWDPIASTISVALHAADDYEQVVALEAANRQLVDNLPVIVARFEPGSGATTFVNGALERVLGVRPADAVGTGVQVRLADPLERAEFERACARAARGQDTEWQDRRYRHTDGRVLTMRERVYPVFDAEGIVNGVELIAYDVTTELESRKALMQADRLASLGALAAGIAHEINNPVAFLVLAAAQVGRLIDSLRDPGSGAEDRLREIAQELGEASGRIAEIVGELKLFTRMADGTSRIPIDVNRVLRTALTLTSSELRRRARLEVVLSDVPLAPGAFATLGQVFVNLLINASQAIDAKGDATPTENHVVRVTSETSGRSIVVRVSDTGVGIAPELLPRIFDPFFTTKASGQGAGLGLAIAYDLVRRVGGDIRVESSPGKGTTFEVILPLEVSPESEEEGRAAVPTPRAPGEALAVDAGQAPRRRVLIIDDERALVKALSRQLQDRYEVEMASTASEALAKLASRDYDVIVCDLRMPDQSGPAIYEAALARSARQASRFIFTTGGSYGLEDDGLHEQMTATGRPILEKPFDGASFEALVARVASGSAAT
jgi:PAS domain S-box-containing protein